MKLSINCKFCKSSWIKKIYTPINSRRGVEVFLCSACGLIQTFYFNKESDKKVSISCDADWDNIRHGKKIRLQHNLRFITKKLNFSSIKSCLDIGANRGDFVKWLRKKYPHIEITAIEPDSTLIDYYNEKIEIITSKFEDAILNKKYDFIYCSHTLEHIESFEIFLEKCRQLLKTNGYLFIEVPNTEIIFYDKNIIEEFFIDKHTFHFIPETLINIFNYAGFNVIAKDITPYNIAILFKKERETAYLFSSNEIAKKEQFYLDVYQKRLRENRLLLIKFCEEKIKPFLKKQKVGFWGASRFFDFFVRYCGFSQEHVYILVDKFISQILKDVHGISVMDPLWLKIYVPQVIFVLARSSAQLIQNTAHEMGFRWVVTFDEIMEQVRLL